MPVDIIERPKTTLIGLRLDDLSPADMARISELWKRFLARKKELTASEPDHAYGVNLAKSAQRFDYLAGVAVRPGTKPPKEMTSVEIPAGRYARFAHRGAISGFIDTIDKVFGEDLPAAGLERGPGPLVEVYGPAFKGAENPASAFDY